MLWAGTEAQVYLGQTEVGVWTPLANHCDVQWLNCVSAIEGWGHGVDLLWQLNPSPRKQHVALWLSGALARPFILQAVEGLGRWSEAAQVAAGVAPDATGLLGPCDVWLDHWKPDVACLAIAFDRSTRSTIEQVARDKRVRLTAMRPWWVNAVNRSAKELGPQTRLLAVEETDALTVLVGTDGRLTWASSLAPRPQAGQMEDALTRAMLATNVSAVNARRTRMGTRLHAPSPTGSHQQAEPFAVQLEPLG